MSFLTGRFGRLAIPVGATLAGFFDVHAAVTSVPSIAAAASIPRVALITAVLLAVMTNTTTKLVAAVAAGGVAYGTHVAGGSAGCCARDVGTTAVDTIRV